MDAHPSFVDAGERGEGARVKAHGHRPDTRWRGRDGRPLTERCACVEWRGFEVRKVVDVGRVAQR
jgi:hypothetical protein